ncbi:hypothetical protein EF405_20265 [Cyclobacteriaceae bacterium YHN15]|nr:hypothetical protein EF405_20265 [Cyclobacteriaceae bacterium YHN15]
MAVIFGFILLNSATHKEEAENPFPASYWSHEKSKSISEGGFYFEIYQHPSLPYAEQDFFHQDAEGKLSILMSGEIYNREKLILEFFPDKDFKFDPELIASLYNKLGISFLEKLNGDFSVVISDKHLGKSFLIRDHLGVKPLAYAVMDGRLYFSSDYIDLGKVLFKGQNPDRDFILQFVRDISFIDYEKTAVKRVKKVLPGHYVMAEENSIQQKPYWFPENIQSNKKLTAQEAIKNMKELVADAVKIRSSTKFRAAAHVSGGLDSGLVAILARKQYEEQETFVGFSWSPPSESADESFPDERALVEQVVNQARMQGDYLALDPLDNWNSLSNWKYYGYFFQEEQVLKRCQEKGINLLFSGWGGDEFVSINDRGLHYDLFFGLNWGKLLQKKPLSQPKAFIHMLVFQVVFPFVGVPAIDKQHDRWFLGYFKKPFDRRTYDALFFKKGSRRSTHLNLLYNYHIPWRMESEFILGNQYGVEYRYPLLDRRIVEFMLEIPSKVLAAFPYSRPLIREISKGVLPEQVRMHTSKLDAARLDHFYGFLKKAMPFFLNELEAIRNNPDLGFLDFGKIEEDIEKVQSGTYPYDENEFLILLNNIKKMHEFSRGYKSD